MAYNIDIEYTTEFLRGMILEDLDVLLREANKRLFELRCQSSPTGRVKVVRKPHLFNKIKKDIARMKTILREGL